MPSPVIRQPHKHPRTRRGNPAKDRKRRQGSPSSHRPVRPGQIQYVIFFQTLDDPASKAPKHDYEFIMNRVLRATSPGSGFR